MASPFPVGRAPPLPPATEGRKQTRPDLVPPATAMPSSRRASLLPRLPRRLRGCSALHATAAALEHPFHTATSTLGAPSRAMGLCLRRHQTPSPRFPRRRLCFFRAFRASTAALGHPFRTATSTLGAPSRAMGLCLRRHQTSSRLFAATASRLPRFPCIYRGVWASFPHSYLDAWRSFPRDGACASPPANAFLPFAAAALLLPRFPCIYRGAWASFPHSHLDAWRSFPRDWPVPSPPAKRLPTFHGGGFASSALSVHLPRRLSILSAQLPRRLALLPARWRLCLRRRQTPSYLSRRRLCFFRAFRASTAAFGHPFRTATSTLGAPSRAMAPVPSPPSNVLPRFHGGDFAASALSPFRRASLLPLSLSPRLLALRSPAVFPASKSRKNSGRGIDRARWQ